VIAHSPASVAVLGAGLTGVATALELAGRGARVTLIEQDERPLNRASLRNEGKIHLGLIYANDPSLRTARLQLRGSLQFRTLLSRWMGATAERLGRSTPFVYLVAGDSLYFLSSLPLKFK
jgi:glycine/D-amino acid oxidase-like deaminating enzyme